MEFHGKSCWRRRRSDVIFLFLRKAGWKKGYLNVNVEKDTFWTFLHKEKFFRRGLDIKSKSDFTKKLFDYFRKTTVCLTKREISWNMRQKLMTKMGNHLFQGFCTKSFQIDEILLLLSQQKLTIFPAKYQWQPLKMADLFRQSS